MMGDFVLRVVSNDRIAHETHDVVMEFEDAPRDFSPLPGQFAHIAAREVFLRRPISIAGYDHGNRRVRFIVRAVGRGTEAITSMLPGDFTKALMPLGNPFPMELAKGARVWLVGGGIGVAPLIYAAGNIFNEGSECWIKSFLGFRDERDVFGERELAAFGEVFTDTGGFVTDLVKNELATSRPDVVFSCGPALMMAALQKICGGENIKAYASLEARMGCGVGACLVCNCLVSAEPMEYRRVCKDGPVFDIAEVVLP